ncbi:MAG TPA: hypothetical protein VGG03_13395 [Thermoanaerobaculia bacterium]|jgi:hypothetical protein
MSPATRLILILMLPICSGLSAQETPVVTEGSTSTPAATESTIPAAHDAARTSDEVLQDFSALLRQHPPELGTILALDPTLLSNQAFLAQYPELARFVAEHPEVRHNPRFYLREFQVPRDRGGVLEDILEPLMVFAAFVLIAFALAWLVRTVIEQKRWNWLSRTQREVHGKLFDRFGTSAEILEYMKTPAGTKFLEAAPIPLHTDRATSNPPLSRVLWSIQVGVVVAAAALGMLIVSGRFEGEAGQELFAMGVIAFCVGVGFVASAAVSIFLSRRLGLWQTPHSSETASADRFDDPGLVR